MPLSPMMQAKLKRALNATRIAVVGASPEQLSVGLGPLYNLTRAPFGGAILPVNPKYDSILGLKCSPDLESLDPPPELAILLVNQHLAVEMTERAARCGVQAVVIVAGGFKEVREGGLELEVRLREVAERTQTPVIGPNTLGASAFHRGLHGIFWHLDASSGSVAVISQSGGVGLTVAYGLRQLHCGLSHLIGVGNRSVVDFADYLEVLKDDPGVRAFCLFLEGLEEPRGLYEAARGITTSKPIVVYKAGKNQAVARATATHTGSLTGDYRLYRAMFAQAGMVEVSSSREAAVAVKALSMLPQPTGNRLCALTFTAGPAIVAMDLLISGGWELPDLSAATKRRVEGIIGEKTPVDLQNPIDLTGPGFLPHTYGRVLEAILAEDVDAYFLVWNFNPLIRFPLAELSTFRDKAARPVVLVLLAHAVEADPHLRECARRSLCAYLTPEDGATALNAMLTDTRARERLLGRRFP